jgi:hypothetical protein
LEADGWSTGERDRASAITLFFPRHPTSDEGVPLHGQAKP